jgi:hypothetical protein
MLFEEQPALLVIAIVAVVEIWLRVRKPLGSAARRMLTRRHERL